ncbi:hypothetical protein [Nocardia arthritidis]|uniref:Uncharacterized protein n=1 Tax=Nocardia arthritidis TaxID=228602 RepID=A0A6G9YR96_9NOCA|nr:hypothetical protein [Nocardia arthritidis]QIS15744.1 hypothetical protein F5544_39630 [Nocardia arthritidis]
MGALTQEAMRATRVQLTPEQRDARRREAEKLGIKIRRHRTTAADVKGDK